MKKKLIILILLSISLLVACSAIKASERPPAPQAFPTATSHFLFQGNVPVGIPDSSVSISTAPTIASIFLEHASATSSPVATSTITPEPEHTATPTTHPQFYMVTVYEENLNPNWEVQQDTRMRFDLKSSSHVYRGHAAISFAPRKEGNATLFITVSDQAKEIYRRDQVAKLSFWLYSPEAPLYLDQFYITLVGSNRLPYWSAEDQKVANYLSVFPQISLDELGFDRAVPADTWVMVEMALNEVQALAPEYQYVTGVSFTSSTDSTHPLLIEDISLMLVGKPPKRSALDITPEVDSE